MHKRCERIITTEYEQQIDKLSLLHDTNWLGHNGVLCRETRAARPYSMEKAGRVAYRMISHSSV
jgi:hypothetical protein